MGPSYLRAIKSPATMTPILIEPLSEQAYELLRQLEALHILRVIEETAAPAPPTRQWAGSLPDAAASKLREHTEQVRSEWERTF